MIVFLNGAFVPADQAVVSVLDRGFLYGDGLFETLPVHNGKPFQLPQHLARLGRGADFLKITLPFSPEEIRRRTVELIERNQMPESVLRINLSRGAGPRGFSPAGAQTPTLVLSLHPAPAPDLDSPPQWSLLTSNVRVCAGDPLLRHKTTSKLPQILARTEADQAGADEALLLNTNGEVVEGSASNVFWIQQGTVCTTPLSSGALPGVTRAVVLELCRQRSIPCREISVSPGALLEAGGVFLTLSTMGIVEAAELDGQCLDRSPVTRQLQAGYQALLKAECDLPASD